MKFWIVVVAFVVMAVLAQVHPHPGPLRCHEDEIIAWDGDRHTVCVNLDEVEDYYAAF